MLAQVEWPIRIGFRVGAHAGPVSIREQFQRLNGVARDTDVLREGLSIAAVGAIEQLLQRVNDLPPQSREVAPVHQSADFFYGTEFVLRIKNRAHVNAPAPP